MDQTLTQILASLYSLSTEADRLRSATAQLAADNEQLRAQLATRETPDGAAA